MPSLHIEYEICEVVSLFLSTKIINSSDDYVENFIKKMYSLMGVSIDVYMLIKEMFP